MKNVLLILIIATLFACTERKREEIRIVHEQEKREIEKHNMDFLKGTITYFKDDSTGLCFAMFYSGNVDNSITCVPCDSLKNVTVK